MIDQCDPSSMAEAWDNSKDLDWLLRIADRTPVPRGDLRRFACWCARNTPLSDGRTTWDLLPDKRLRNAILVSERYEAGSADHWELVEANNCAWGIVDNMVDPASHAASTAVAWTTDLKCNAFAVREASRFANLAARKSDDVHLAQFRKMIRNPFRREPK